MKYFFCKKLKISDNKQQDIKMSSTQTFNRDISSSTDEKSTIMLESIYIPRVYANIPTHFIAETFESLNIGAVDRVEAIPRPGDKTTYMAFVYFSSWNVENKAAVHLAERINSPSSDTPQARIVYDDPWYWILLPNKSKKEEKTETLPSDGICAQQWELQQKWQKNQAELIEHEMQQQQVEELTSTEEFNIVLDMVEDLQVRLRASEKKNDDNENRILKLQQDLYDVRTILLTGQSSMTILDHYPPLPVIDVDTNVDNDPMIADIIQHAWKCPLGVKAPPPPPPLKLTRQTATGYPFPQLTCLSDGYPSSHPKLTRQNAMNWCNDDEDTETTEQEHLIEMIQKGLDEGRISRRHQHRPRSEVLVDMMGLVYHDKNDVDNDAKFWCDP